MQFKWANWTKQPQLQTSASFFKARVFSTFSSNCWASSTLPSPPSCSARANIFPISSFNSWTRSAWSQQKKGTNHHPITKVWFMNKQKKSMSFAQGKNNFKNNDDKTQYRFFLYLCSNFCTDLILCLSKSFLGKLSPAVAVSNERLKVFSSLWVT